MYPSICLNIPFGWTQDVDLECAQHQSPHVAQRAKFRRQSHDDLPLPDFSCAPDAPRRPSSFHCNESLSIDDGSEQEVMDLVLVLDSEIAALVSSNPDVGSGRYKINDPKKIRVTTATE